MLIGKKELEELIPHAGAMCLLEGVVSWNEASISCVATSHTEKNNPLRARGRLHALCGVEYVSQTMAVHGRLAGGIERRPRAGYLVSLRDLECQVDRLDALDGELLIEAERLMGDDEQVIYRFKVSHDGSVLLSGRAAAVLAVGPA